MLLFQLKQVKNVYDARVSHQQTEEIGHVLGLCTIKSRFFCRSVKGFTESELCQNTHTHRGHILSTFNYLPGGSE